MRIEKPNFYIVTGGPGAGKTTLIDALAARGFACAEEAGRKIIKEQKWIGGSATHDGDRLAFRDLMLAHDIAEYERMRNLASPVFFDRGIPDLAGYCRLIGADVPLHVEDAVTRYRYNGTVFIAPPWEAIYGNDAERQQDFREAVATHDAIAEAYMRAGYEPVELPKTDVSTRADFVLRRIYLQSGVTMRSK